MFPVFVLLALQAPARTAADSIAPPPSPATAADSACHDRNARDIVICGQRGQPYRVDPDVMEASREAQTNERSATSAVPPAQALCARAPAGPPPPCGNGLGSLDLANVGIIVATTALKAAKGEDWRSIFRPAGPDEYQLYRQAIRLREAENDQRAAAKVRAEALEAEGKRKSQAVAPGS